MGAPGWPELAFWTASMDSVLIVLMHSCLKRLLHHLPVPPLFSFSNYSRSDAYTFHHIAFMPPW